MRKLSIKIIVTIMIVFFLSTLVPRLLFSEIIDDIQTGRIERDVIFFGMLFSATLALLLFAFAINHIIIKRIKLLNDATKRVSKGDFDVVIPGTGKDEISSLSKNFNIMVGELKANAYLSSSFARQFSHEFKTPVTAINGYAQMIVADPLSTEEIKESALVIARESSRLSRLSESVLLLSRLESNTIIRTDDHYNATEQIRNIIRVMQFAWETKEIFFEIDMDEVIMTSNKDMTYQLFHNLIENAIRYGNKGSQIDIQMHTDQTCLIFTITNSGEGIPLDDRIRIFDVFQMSKARDPKSTGIGLSIVRTVVSKLKGSVTISGPEEGPTTFVVTLPINS